MTNQVQNLIDPIKSKKFFKELSLKQELKPKTLSYAKKELCTAIFSIIEKS